MRKSNKQRRISQNQQVVVSASLLQQELFSFLFGGPSLQNNASEEQKKRNHGDDHGESKRARLEAIIRSFPRLCMEDDEVAKQVHGLLVLQLSASTTTNTAKRSYKRDTLACLEALYGATNINQMLQVDEKLVVLEVLLRVLNDEDNDDSLAMQQEANASLVQLSFSILRNLFASPNEWHRLPLHQFRTLLISLANRLSRDQAMQDLQTIATTTEGFQQQMALVVLQALTGQSLSDPRRRWGNPSDYLTLLDIETKLQVGSELWMEPSLIERCMSIASTTNDDMAQHAVTCLALAGEKQPDDKYIIEALFQVLVNGVDEVSEIAVPGLSRCISRNNVNPLALGYVCSNTRPVICAVLQVIQLNAHANGKDLSMKSAEILESLFSSSRDLQTDIPVADMVAICGALLENPHVEVSSCMCSSMIDCLSAIDSEYGEVHVDAVEVLAKFIVDQPLTIDDAAVSRGVIEYYGVLLEKHNACLLDLPRVPQFVESIVKILSSNWERVLLRDPCFALLVKLSLSPHNQRRMARTGGVIPLMVKYCREMDEAEVHSSNREKVKECIQTLAGAI